LQLCVQLDNNLPGMLVMFDFLFQLAICGLATGEGSCLHTLLGI